MNANKPHSNVEGKMFTEPLKKNQQFETGKSSQRFRNYSFAKRIWPNPCGCVSARVESQYRYVIPFVSVVLPCKLWYKSHAHQHSKHMYITAWILPMGRRLCMCVFACDTGDIPWSFVNRIKHFSWHNNTTSNRSYRIECMRCFRLEIRNKCAYSSVASHRIAYVRLGLKWLA